MDNNITWQNYLLKQIDYEKKNGHKAAVVWLTGLSGSGKSTIANALNAFLFDKGYFSNVLDGDNIRHGLNSDLGFEDGDRKENIRRVGETAKLFKNSGSIVITAFISPFKNDRMVARKIIGDNFFEIFISADIETCKKRDPKGLYYKVERGAVQNFTGITSGYEEPENPELIINTDDINIEMSTRAIIKMLSNKGIIN